MMRALCLALVLLGCAQGAEPIRWGTDTCDQCRMVLADRRFGAEFVSRKGRVFKFDDAEELGRYLKAHPMTGTAYVTDGESGNLVPAEASVFLKADAIRSPMGSHLMTFQGRAEAEAYANRQGWKPFTLLTYQEAIGASH